MSIIQDALKKAQEDRRKKSSREVPYHLSGVQKKSKTAAIIYAVAGFCVAAVFAYLYIPYFHKPKQIMQPVVAQAPAQARLVQAVVNVPPALEAQKTVKVPADKRNKDTTVPDLQKPIEKPIVPETSKNKQDPTGAKIGIAHGQKIALLPSVKKKRKVVELSGKEEAMSEPLRVVEKKTDDGTIDNMYNEASREQQAGRTREAKAMYKQILTKQPDHIETLNNLGVIAIYEANTQEALFYFKRILEYRKNYSKAYNNIGLIAMKDGDRQLAEEYLRKAISLEPDDPGPYVNLSALLRSQGRLQEAAKLLEIPIQKKAKDPDLFLSYAVIKDNLGQYGDASRYYRYYLSSILAPTSRKDIIDRLQYIEKKIITNDQITITK
jgi:Flp pilus assembly protein TadD